MMHLTDKDLLSVQEVRNLIKHAKEAQSKLAKMSQEEINKIVKAIADAGCDNAEKLAKMANEETGFGKWQDKVIKNIFASRTVYDSIKDLKTVGVIREDEKLQIMDIAVPMGVIAGIVPSTNPTSTVIYKTLISLKGANSIVFSPHPSAKKCILETVRVISEAAERAGCPKGAIGCISIPTLDATNELMRHDDTAMILATGGGAMVKAAYSSGNPALGVGAGNGPGFIDKSANIKLAVKRILDSKTFDNGTICASEQSIVVEKSIESIVVEELKAQGAYFLDDEESKKLEKFIMRPNGTMNPQIVGRTVEYISNLANLTKVPKDAKVLIARETRIGLDVPYSREKLGPILAFYTADNLDEALRMCKEILLNEGAGHSFMIHAEDKNVVKRFALEMPVSRIPVNSPGALGGIGATVNLAPALTLGCGSIGGSATSDNVGPLNLINTKRVAYGIKEIEDLRVNDGSCSIYSEQTLSYESEALIELLVKKIIKELK